METSPSTSTCLICNESAHGVHFGVLSCRACAAFFRRTTVLGKKYQCKNKTECAMNNDEKVHCRYCRYKKCLSHGMTPENVKYNYDTMINIQPGKSPQKASTTTKKFTKKASRMKSLNNAEVCNSDVKELTYELRIDKNGETRVKLDVSGLLINVKAVLQDYTPSPKIEKMSSLRKMEIGLLEYRELTHTNVIKFVGEISIRDVLKTSNQQIKLISKYLLHSDQFRLLDMDDKMMMLKSIWVQWKRLERFTWTAKLFGKRMYDERIITILPGIAAYSDNLKVDCAHIIFPKKGNLKPLMEKYNDNMMEQVGKPITELELTTMEIAFMLSHMSWHHAGKQLQGKVLHGSEKELEQLSNDLHYYYVNDMKMPNYASRLIKIMNVVNSVQKIHFDRQNMMDLARIFDYFRVEVSDPEMFKSYF